MAVHKSETQWMGKMQFNSLVNGHVVVMDAPVRGGGEDNGSIPKPFILTALSSCAGMELMVLLKKNDITINGLDIKTNGELTQQIPFYYTSINIEFEIKTDKEWEEKIILLIDKVMTEICGVSFMLQKIMPVTWAVKYK